MEVNKKQRKLKQLFGKLLILPIYCSLYAGKHITDNYFALKNV